MYGWTTDLKVCVGFYTCSKASQTILNSFEELFITENAGRYFCNYIKPLAKFE